MYYPSNYVQQAETLRIMNKFQLEIFGASDVCTYLRELGKVGVVVGAVYAASSVVFNFDVTLGFSLTAVSGASWLVARFYAQELEAQAQEMMQNVKTFQTWKESQLHS